MKGRRSLPSSILTILLTTAVGYPLSAADRHYTAGYEAIQQKQWARAVTELEKSYQAAPQAKTAYLVAYAYSRMGDVVGTRAWGVAALRGKPPLEQRYRIAVPRLLGWADAAERRVTIRMVCTMSPAACDHLTNNPLKRTLPEHVNAGRDADVDTAYGRSIDETDGRLRARGLTEAGSLEAAQEESAFRKTNETWLSRLTAPDTPLPPP